MKPLSTPARPQLHFLYHELRPEPAAYSYVVACREFEEHLQTFRQLHNEAVGLEPAVTFDDGHLSDVRYALPRLLEAGLKARFFVTAGWTGQRSGFMSTADLRTLHAEGMNVGAHGWSHKLLTSCSPAELRVELVDARARLQDALGAPVETMSLPGGRSSARVLQACAEAGYTAVYNSEPRISVHHVEETGLATLGRINLRSGTPVAWLQRLLDPSTGILKRLQRIDCAKRWAQSALGDHLYARAWAMVNRHEGKSRHTQELP